MTRKDFRGVDARPLSYEAANRLYDFLVARAGAQEEERDMFVHEMCRSFPALPSWRFRAGSFQRRTDAWVVFADQDDVEMYGTADLIEALNAELMKMREEILGPTEA